MVGTPCEHLPGGEVTGFIVTAPSFGTTDGKPNALYFSGDTVYLPELAKMKEQYRMFPSFPLRHSFVLIENDAVDIP